MRCFPYLGTLVVLTQMSFLTFKMIGTQRTSAVSSSNATRPVNTPQQTPSWESSYDQKPVATCFSLQMVMLPLLLQMVEHGWRHCSGLLRVLLRGVEMRKEVRMGRCHDLGRNANFWFVSVRDKHISEIWSEFLSTIYSIIVDATHTLPIAWHKTISTQMMVLNAISVTPKSRIRRRQEKEENPE